ncbi:aldo-keto reductase superfamily protein [Sugiyamaella lignohabitans]|uniref:Aldo-keto reductase superfamily protein n=1 Tax=Sugiyamaella lignohabitans TaxID=796027 RepID=A0A167DRX5_9ASCO|nr:aldo-keto reductase superfamily protein [Sugiyamaella lignohabitans]ANB13220.1 aldo-keto reductase superfamily protein [Sugiyamaella lignohabitans]
MSYGKKSWNEWVLEDEELVFSLMKKAYDVGIRTFDTADMYSDGHSEILVGKFLKKYNIPRSTIVILSKCYNKCDSDPSIENTELNWINRWGLSRKHIFDAVEDSVKRLGTYIDVLQIHRLDRETSKEEIMEALHDVVKSGQVRYIGASSMRATEFAQLQFIAEKHNWTKFISMQNFYNLVYREEEREMIPYCKETGVGLIPWSPVARGVLARPVGEGSLRSSTDKFAKFLKLGHAKEDQEIINRVEEVAKKRGISMAQVAIAWTLSKGTAPIVGFNKLERIDEAVEAISIKLTDEEISYLEEPYIPHPVAGF